MPSPTARSGHSALDQWDPEVLALFTRAQAVLRDSTRDDAAREAAALLQKALVRAPEEAALWRYLSEAWAAVPDFEKASAASSRAVEMNPSAASTASTPLIRST